MRVTIQGAFYLLSDASQRWRLLTSPRGTASTGENPIELSCSLLHFVMMGMICCC